MHAGLCPKKWTSDLFAHCGRRLTIRIDGPFPKGIRATGKELPMLELIRFTSGSHAEEFMVGRLYMNSLGFFWSNGFEGQRDMLEGVAQMQDPKDSLFSEECQNALCASVMIHAEAFQFCNLLCFHSSLRWRSPDSNEAPFLDVACQSPVMPMGTLRYSVAFSPNHSSSSCVMGRGPITDMSPLRTLRNCGNSSSEVFRMNFPTRVTD